MRISLAGIIVTVKTTKNFWQAVALTRSKKKKRIIFRNGSILQLSGSEYFSVRDLIASGCKVEKPNDTQFIVRGGNFEVMCSSELLVALPTLTTVQKNINIKKVEQIDRDTFKVETDKIKLVGNLGIVYALFDVAGGVYDCECLGKIVLDIGGFQGETAAYFSSIGAKKVIVYEPVASHQKFIKTNMTLNNVNAELHEEGIGNMNGNQIVHYESFSLGFGLGKGPKSVEIRIRDIAEIIKNSNADIAKLDCEGAEIALLQVPIQILRRISYYMVEVHSSKILELVIQKFITSGFKLTKNILASRDTENVISVVHFART